MSHKINPEVKAKWVAALRSGEYQQCQGQLRNGNDDDGSPVPGTSFCCLGVLTELYAKEHGEPFEAIATYEQGTPPLCVCEWAGFEEGSPDPVVYDEEGIYYSLAELNDGYDGRPHSFAEIAAVIEEQL